MYVATRARTRVLPSLYDRLRTWRCLGESLGLLDCFLLAQPCKSTRNGSSPTSPFQAPGVSCVGLVLLLLREGFSLRLQNSKLPSSDPLRARQWFEALLRRFPVASHVDVSLDKNFTINALGDIEGANHCRVYFREGGLVDFSELNKMVSSERKFLVAQLIQVDTFSRLGDEETVLSAFQWLCRGPLQLAEILLLTQLVWGLGKCIEGMLLAEHEQFRSDGTTRNSDMTEADVGGERKTYLFQLRYHMAGVRASRASSILSVGVDASRVAGRQRLIGAATTPAGCAFWMKTMVTCSVYARD